MVTNTLNTKPLDDVTYVRSDLRNALPSYTLVRDCVEQKVKDKTTVYLPMPSVEESDTENAARYAAYLLRAVFYAVTSRTLLGMVGQVYASEVEVKLPAELEFMRLDATGTGLSLEQVSMATMYDIMACGRAGLYADYPTTEGPVTVKQLNDGDIRPTITAYRPEAVINWRVKRRGGKFVPSLIVLVENIDVEGMYNIETIPQYRELILIDNIYHVRLWRNIEVTPTNATMLGITYAAPGVFVMQMLSDLVPRDGRGFPFDSIPFTFVGAMNNDVTVDEPPLRDLAELNIAHYRNSADYEEACFLVGQPTPWFSGLTEDWVTDVLKGKVMLGSRAAVLLPENSQAGLLQVTANSMPMEAMKHKEAQMVALGARLVENRAVRRTLGEVQQSNASETSILASCANNVSAAYTFILKCAAAFVSAAPAECSFRLPTDFALNRMSVEERTQLIADMQAGALSFTEVRTQLRRAGLTTQDDAAAKLEIDARQEAQAALKAVAPAAPVGMAGAAKIDNRMKA